MRYAQITFLSLLTVMIISCSSQSVKTESTASAEKAYNFTLPDQNGVMTSLDEVLKNQKGAVIAFYPKDDSKN